MRLEHLAGHGADTSELDIIARQIPQWRKHGGGAEMQRHLYDTQADFSAMIGAMREQDGWNV